MSVPSLSADCARCAALCCVALSFERSESFALDKQAGEPCPHLDGDRCAIHADRDSEGFGGCLAFDCHGAGQRLTQEAFAGRHWRDDDETARAMFDAFFILRALHELLLLVATARRLPAAAALSRELDAQWAILDRAASAKGAAIGAVDVGALRRGTHALLRRIGALHGRRGARLVVLESSGSAPTGEASCPRRQVPSIVRIARPGPRRP